jgi:phi LC3 family holin
MNNINWKVRLQSGSWWMGIISAVVVAVFAILKIFKVETSVTADEIMNVAMLVLMIPAAIGITTDPTTKGVSDSEQALTYDSPKEDEEKGGLMTYDEFVRAYNGKATDYDGAYGAQCVDLIKMYLNKVFGIKPGSWGNAKYYWLNFEKHSELVKNFTKIKNTASFVPQAGDIMVWNGNVGGGCGHVAICTGEGNTSEFYSYDQNWNGKEMHKVKHDYDDVYGVLRPKEQGTVAPDSVSAGAYVPSVKWQNGSTTEKVYARSDFKEEIGSLSPREVAKCFGKKGNAYCVQYDLDGTSKHKVGFVKYAGGVTNAPTSGRNYKNGSTVETVYTDTAKKAKAGSLDVKEACLCPTKTDGMFLVIYKVNGTSAYKCGFVDYDGGVE